MSQPLSGSAESNVERSIISSGASASASVPISSSNTPSSLKPLRTTHQGPANRVQKPGVNNSSKDSGLTSNYILPGRLTQPSAPARKNNTRPLPNNSKASSSASRASTVKGTDKSRLNIKNITSEASRSAISSQPITKMEDGKAIKSESDPKIKEEIKSEPEDDIMDLDQFIRAKSPLTREALESYSSAHKQLLYLRFRIQRISQETTSRGSLSSNDALELQEHLKELNTYPWEKGIYESTKIGKALRTLCTAQTYGDVIASRAEQLRSRWKAGDFSPGVFEDEENELVDSSDEEEETSESEDDRPVASRSRPLQSSMREQVNACVDRLLRGMLVARSKNGHKIYTLDPRGRKINADVFGHNGLTVGDWWPFQSFTLKDGAHGSKMGGIYGRIREGAYSVVVSGGTYDENDHDSGDRILYSGSKGGDKTQEDATNAAPYTTATQSMITSTRSRQPVRVLRSSKCNSRWSPTAGIRYDGLYDVQSYSIETDKLGKKFYQFVLSRRPNQLPIDRTRPTPVEVSALERIRAL